MTTEDLVQDEPKEPVVEEETTTPGSEEVSEEETPEETSVDAEALMARYERDLSQLKSSLQKRESKLTREWQEREAAYKRQLEELAVQNMDEDERKVYESKRAAREIEDLRARVREAEVQSEQAKASYAAIAFFMDKGVPLEELTIDDDYETLVQSGWDWIETELTRLRSSSKKPPKKKEELPKSEAPEVVTTTGAPPKKPGWDELTKKYGSMEEVFRLVEQGDLPPTIIPLKE